MDDILEQGLSPQKQVHSKREQNPNHCFAGIHPQQETNNNNKTPVHLDFQVISESQQLEIDPRQGEKVNGGVCKRKPQYCSREGRSMRELIIACKCLKSYSTGNAEQLFSIFIQDRTKGDALNSRMKDSI